MTQRSQIIRQHELHCPKRDEERRIVALRADMDRVAVRCKSCGHTWASAGKGAWRLWEWKKSKARRRESNTLQGYV